MDRVLLVESIDELTWTELFQAGRRELEVFLEASLDLSLKTHHFLHSRILGEPEVVLRPLPRGHAPLQNLTKVILDHLRGPHSSYC